MPDFLPRKDLDLLAWSANFSHFISSDPEQFNLTQQQADIFAISQQAFEQALAPVSNLATRSRSLVVAKDQAKAAMIAQVRELAGLVRSRRSVTPEMLIILGFKVTERKRKINAPGSAPFMHVVPSGPNSVRVILMDKEATTNRGKPAGVAGASIYFHLGDNAPADIVDWQFHGNQTRVDFEITLPGPIAYGQQVWITAAWFNPRAQNGPLATPTPTRVIGGGVQMPRNLIAA